MTEQSHRQGVRELAEQSGWQQRCTERIDIFLKGDRNVEVLWTEDAISGGSLYHEYHLAAHTREPAKIKEWLTKW